MPAVLLRGGRRGHRRMGRTRVASLLRGEPEISMAHLRIATLAVLALLAVACSRGTEPVTEPENVQLGAVGARDEATAEPEPEPAQEEAPAAEEEEAAPPAEDQTAPATYTVRLDTTAGEILIDVTRAWAPRGADRFYSLVQNGYYTDVAFFRVISGFMAQAGIHGDPAMNRVWRTRRIEDDPVTQSNTRGMVTFATAGPNTRTTQFFINFGNNSNLDRMGFAPFGRVRDMTAVDALYAGYGEGAPRGRGPSQGRMQSEGNTYLRAEFPQLSYIRSASIAE
jgi:peptidyl-prolyl cis-trans isomerase A (cyclophilin A)